MKKIKYRIYEVEMLEAWSPYDIDSFMIKVVRADLSRNPEIDKTKSYHNYKTKKEAIRRLKYYQEVIKEQSMF